MSKARDLANVLSTGNLLADGVVSYSEVTGTPVLATVATSGAYSDLSGTPALPTFPTGDVVGTSDTQTLTNKTINNPILTLSSTQGEVGQVPISQGPNQPPIWASAGVSYATLLKFE